MSIAALIDIECNSEREFGFDRIAMRIARFPEIQTVAVVSGRADLTIKIKAEKLEDISRFVTDTLAPMDGVKSTSTQFFLKTYKLNGEILEAEPKPNRLPISA